MTGFCLLSQDAVVDDDAGVLVPGEGLVDRDRERGLNNEFLHRGSVGGEVGLDAQVVSDQASDVCKNTVVSHENTLGEQYGYGKGTHEDRPLMFQR